METVHKFLINSMLYNISQNWWVFDLVHRLVCERCAGFIAVNGVKPHLYISDLTFCWQQVMFEGPGMGFWLVNQYMEDPTACVFLCFLFKYDRWKI